MKLFSITGLVNRLTDKGVLSNYTKDSLLGDNVEPATVVGDTLHYFKSKVVMSAVNAELIDIDKAFSILEQDVRTTLKYNLGYKPYSVSRHHHNVIVRLSKKINVESLDLWVDSETNKELYYGTCEAVLNAACSQGLISSDKIEHIMKALKD